MKIGIFRQMKVSSFKRGSQWIKRLSSQEQTMFCISDSWWKCGSHAGSYLTSMIEIFLMLFHSLPVFMTPRRYSSYSQGAATLYYAFVYY